MGTLYHFDAEPLAFHDHYGSELQVESAEFPEAERVVINRALRVEHDSDSLESKSGGQKFLRGILVAALFEATVILGFVGAWHLWCRIR